MHLNLNIDNGLPAGAKGVLAELAGASPLSPATSAMLQRPKAMMPRYHKDIKE